MPRLLPSDHPPFTGLPVRYITVDGGAARMAVHVAGRLNAGSLPLICVPGYQRNMTDFADFVGQLQRQLDPDWPVVLLDLLGRGRSADRPRGQPYISTQEARDVAAVADALGIGSAVFVGQGHGGQVLMALSAERPLLNAGTVLIDAGPVSDPRGLVRLRNNLGDIGTLRGETAFRRMSRQMLAMDYPGATEQQLDRLALRTHFLDRRGRVRGLFDPRLLAMLAGFEHDDVLVAQWPLFAGLGTAPLLLMRTHLTEQLRRETFEEMMRRRRDTEGYFIDGQGSPALLDNADDVRPIATFVRKVRLWRNRFSNAAA
jgi:pimeloyl-ACP methyl ester carboxylesterase